MTLRDWNTQRSGAVLILLIIVILLATVVTIIIDVSSPPTVVLATELVRTNSTWDVANEHNKTGLFVLGSNKGRLGNQLFAFAFSLLVSRRTGRQVVLERPSLLDVSFQTELLKHVDHVESELCPCFVVKQNTSLLLDETIRNSILKSMRNEIRDKSILLDGVFGSWVYLTEIEDELRRYLSPKPSIRRAISHFFRNIRPRRWMRTSSDEDNLASPPDYRRIGIHIRAGDMLARFHLEGGYRLPRKEYFKQAMMRLVVDFSAGRNVDHKSRHSRSDEDLAVAIRRIQFIVATDSMLWVRKTYRLGSLAAEIARNVSSTLSGESDVDVDLAYSSGRNPGFDMLMLSMCDAVVMTQGTFGWWSAWLSNKTTIYYSGSPRNRSPIDVRHRGQTYMPNWIGIEGPGLKISPEDLRRQKWR